jgi:hypothetical protein
MFRRIHIYFEILNVSNAFSYIQWYWIASLYKSLYSCRGTWTYGEIRRNLIKWGPTSFPIHRCFCNKSNTTGVTSRAGTACLSGAPEFRPDFSGTRVVRSLVSCVVFCRSFAVFLSFIYWPLYYLSFDLRLLITHLVSSNFIPEYLLSISIGIVKEKQ